MLVSRVAALSRGAAAFCRRSHRQLGSLSPSYAIHSSRCVTARCTAEPGVLPKESSADERSGGAAEPEKPPTRLQRVQNWLFGGPLDKERLKSLGLGALIAYGFVSNVTYGACFVIAWAAHVQATGLTPFAGGQWGAFLARCAGLWALQQIVRPLRFSASMAMTPLVNRMMQGVQERLNISKRTAFLCMFAGLAVVTLTGFAVSLTAATVLNMPKTVT